MRTTANAHSLLQFLMARAGSTYETGQRSITIPFFELKDALTDADLDFSDCDLRITIGCEWVESEFFLSQDEDEIDTDTPKRTNQ